MNLNTIDMNGIRRALSATALTGAAVLSTATGALAQGPAIGTAPASADVRVNVNLKDADMMTAARVLFQRTGIQFVVRPSTKPFDRITLKLDDVTAEDAVRYICEAAGAYFLRDDNGVFIISRERPAPMAAPTVPVVKKAKSYTRIKVLNSDVRQIYDLIKFNKEIDMNRGFEDMKRFSQLVRPGSDIVPAGSGNARYQVNQNSFGPLAQPISNTTTPLVPAERADDILLPGESANQVGGRGGGQGGGGGFGGQGGGGGIGGQGGGVGGQGGGNQAQMEGGVGGLKELTSIDFISFDPTDNSIVVRGSDEDINALRQLIAVFDIAPDQVEIKVEFIAVTEQLDKDLGYEFSYQRLNVFAGTTPGVFAPGGAPVFLNYATGNVVGRLRASLTQTNSKLVNAPIVRTLNNQPAQVLSISTASFFIPQINQTQGAGSLTTYTPVQIQAGTSLTVAPRINYGDRTVTVYLTPQVSGFSGESVGPDGTIIPNQVIQQIAVVARVKDGETIVLGGLTSKTDNSTIQKVPVLGDIPVIGQFFRRSRRNKFQNELLIFVTPRIIDREDSGSTVNPR